MYTLYQTCVNNTMYCKQSWKWIAIGAMVMVTYCRALEQDVGEECTNTNGVTGICLFKNKCSEDTYLGVICNSEKTIICCAKTQLKNKQNFNTSNNQKDNQSLESRFGFFPDFFHAPKPSQKPLPSINFFSHHTPELPNFLGNVLHQNLNPMEFVEDRPLQNFEQDVVNKPNKNKITSPRPTNENIFHSSNNDKNSNIENIFKSDQTTRKPQNYYNSPNYETLKPNQNPNIYNNQAYYETNTANLNNNNRKLQRPNRNQNYDNNNNFADSVSQRPNQNYNNNNNSPSSETKRPNQNNNKSSSSVSQRPNHYQPNNNNNQPNYGASQLNQNNNFNENPSYYTPNFQRPQNNNNWGNNENNSQYPNSQVHSGFTNHHATSSSIVFPDESTDNKYQTTLASTTKTYYQNRPNKNTKRISEIKCEEYSRTLTTTISALPLSIDTSPKPVSIEKCDSKSVGLIVGGAKAELGEFPHMVAIGFRAIAGNPWNCGGTLISEQYVLTAAHCTHSALGEPVQIRLGELNLKKNNDGANPIDLLVDEIIVHPNYVSTSKYNDIALIRMNKAVKFNDHIRPACLYNNNNIYSHKVTATGWGSVAYGDRSSDDLLKVDLDVIDNQQCNKLYEAESKKNTLNKGITNSMMCAGYLEGGHDTCLGDSGGPLVIRSEKNSCIFNLIGITSFGKFCAAENSPGVYTRVSAFLPWIEQIVWP